MIGDTKETLSAKTGRPIEEIYDDEVSAVVIHFEKQEIVFARTSPQHKLEIGTFVCP
jgi:sodium/potassium-transporting ATPase subunit alpha